MLLSNINAYVQGFIHCGLHHISSGHIAVMRCSAVSYLMTAYSAVWSRSPPWSAVQCGCGHLLTSLVRCGTVAVNKNPRVAQLKVPINQSINQSIYLSIYLSIRFCE